MLAMGLPLAGEANQPVILLLQLDRIERVAQVAPQVVDVFDAHR